MKHWRSSQRFDNSIKPMPNAKKKERKKLGKKLLLEARKELPDPKLLAKYSFFLGLYLPQEFIKQICSQPHEVQQKSELQEQPSSIIIAQGRFLVEQDGAFVEQDEPIGWEFFIYAIAICIALGVCFWAVLKVFGGWVVLSLLAFTVFLLYKLVIK